MKSQWRQIAGAMICGVIVFAGYFAFIDGCTNTAQAGVCRVRQRVIAQPITQAVAYAQPLVTLQQVAPSYYYSVGTDLQMDAIAERLAERIEQRLMQREQVREPARAGVLSTSCAKCHSPGTKAVTQQEAPIFFDRAGTLIATDEQRASMRTAAKLGAMPPEPLPILSDDDFSQLKAELDRADKAQQWHRPPLIQPNQQPTPAPPREPLPEPPQPPTPNGEP